jgi:hypothetical protein
MNVFVDSRISGVNEKELQAHFGPHDQTKPTDFWVFCNTVDPQADPARTILVMNEPPLTDHRIYLYSHLSLFHTVIGYNHNGTNLFRFSDNPAIAPYNTCVDWDIRRTDTTLGARKIFYPGQISKNHAAVPHSTGFINLYPLRETIGRAILAADAGYCFGRGWPACTKSYPGHEVPNVNGSFRRQKIVDIEGVRCDFILCLENGIMRNYCCEKFHDGMMVDRVMLYLGEPNITDYLPAECFVDLRQFLIMDDFTFGPADGQPQKVDVAFNTPAMLDLVANMPQKKYDTILHNARLYHESIKGKWESWSKRHQQFIIDRIEGRA